MEASVEGALAHSGTAVASERLAAVRAGEVGWIRHLVQWSKQYLPVKR